MHWFRRTVLSRLWLTYVVMGLSFLVFGVGTVKLFYTLDANVKLIYEHGWQALMDGGAMQFVELILSAYASLAAYLVFKACEYRLSHWMVDGHPSNPHTNSSKQP